MFFFFLRQKKIFYNLNSELLLLPREKITNAKNGGEECSLRTRLLPLAETDSCNTWLCPPGNVGSNLLQLKLASSWLWCWRMESLDGLFGWLWWWNQKQEQVWIGFRFLLLFCSRTKLADAKDGGQECSNYLLRILPLNETNSCNTLPCPPGIGWLDSKLFNYIQCPPVDCTVGEWGAWSGCTATCGGGNKNRTR